MSYVEKTLTSGESVEQFIKYHWWYLTYPALLISFGFIGLVVDNIFIFYLAIALIIYSILELIVRAIIRLSTEQALTNKRVFRKTGLISRNTDELVLEKIETVAVNQSVFERILNFGDIEFTGTGGVYIRFEYVPDPTAVKRDFEQKREG
tara:strand:- start:3031 stop:3480 length:450 start_codon:yes stop_codon:yes gene_type:complete